MYRIYKNILHSFPGDFKILVKCIEYTYFMVYFRRILWLISWSLQDDEGGITCMILIWRLLLIHQRKYPISHR